MRLSTISMLLWWAPGDVQWQSVDSSHIKSTCSCCVARAPNANPCLRLQSELWTCVECLPSGYQQAAEPASDFHRQAQRKYCQRDKRLKAQMSDIIEGKRRGTDYYDLTFYLCRSLLVITVILISSYLSRPAITRILPVSFLQYLFFLVF